MQLIDIIAQKAENDSGYAIAYAILKLVEVLDYNSSDTPHPLEKIAIELADLAEQAYQISQAMQTPAGE